MAALPPAVAKLLKPYSPAVRALAAEARALVLATLPAAQEQVDPADHLLAYGDGLKMKDVVCVIMPLTVGVNLLLANGTALPAMCA